jgi:MFS family permease
MAVGKDLIQRKEFLLLIIPLIIVEFVRGAFIVSYVPNLALYSSNISLTVVGLAISVHFISDAGTNLIIGYIMERLGSTLVIHLSFLCSTAGLLMIAMSVNNWTLLLSSFLLGIGICPIWLVLLTKASGEKRGQNMSLIYLGWLIGIGSGSILMNYFLQFNHSSLIWMIPSLMALAWAIFSIVKKESGVYYRTNFKQQWVETLGLLKNSKVIMPGILLQGIAMGMLIPILPSFAMNLLHLSHSQYSLLMLIGGGSFVLFIVPMGKVADRINKGILIIFGFGLLAISLFILTFSPNLAVTIICVILLGLFYALLLPAWNSFLAGYIPDSLKEASWGIFSAIQGLGVMAGPIIGGFLAVQNKIATTIEVSSMLLGFIALFYLFYFLFKKFQPQSA